MNRRSALEFSPGAAGPLLADDLSWQDRAECQYTDPGAFYPERGGSVRAAKRVCRTCEVRAACLEYALDNDERFGVWGGLSERERRRILRGRMPAVSPLCPKGLHPRTPENTYSDGKCRACKLKRENAKRAAERVARTGSASPRSGRRLAA